MKYIYPAIFKQDLDGIIVTFPDLPDTFTDGDSMEDAFENAEDVLNLMLWGKEENKKEIPAPTSPNKINVPKDAILAMIKADTLAYRKIYDNKLVRKSVIIPNWLNTIAKEHNINFSNILQKAIKQECGIA